MNASRPGLAALALLAATGVLAAGCTRAPQIRVLGRDAVGPTAVLENHGESLARWAADGTRGATLVNLDAHHDLRPLPPEDLGRLRDLFACGDMDAVERACTLGEAGLYDEGSFIAAAAGLGVVTNVVWVVPFRSLGAAAPDAEFRAALAASGIAEAEASRFVRADGCLSGAIGGVPLRVCGLENLPPFPDPVIVTVDLDFVVALEVERGIGTVEAVETTLAALAARRYRVSSASVACSVDGGWVPITERWVADALAAAISDPRESLRGSSRWRPLELADRLALTGRPEEVVRAVEPHLRDPRLGPPLLAYLADARYSLDDIGGALSAARSSCAADRRYCYSLPAIGRALAAEGRVEEAERFFQQWYALTPSLRYWPGEADIALACVRVGRRAEALAHLARLRQAVRSYSGEFVAAHLLAMAGDQSAADLHLDLAMALLQQGRYAEPRAPEIEAAIVWAHGRFVRTGRVDKAARLRDAAGAVGMSLPNLP